MLLELRQLKIQPGQQLLVEDLTLPDYQGAGILE